MVLVLYERDPVHLDRLQTNLSANNCSRVIVVPAAVSKEEGELEFVQVLGNTTGSQFAGSKPNPYGPLERFPVMVVPSDRICPANRVRGRMLQFTRRGAGLDSTNRVSMKPRAVQIAMTEELA
jgi:FkbM family methyltransferase